jgi:hypothetical protein
MKASMNLKIITIALALALWYNACARLFALLIPKGMNATLVMFGVSALILLWDDGCIAELLFDFKNNRVFKEDR